YRLADLGLGHVLTGHRCILHDRELHRTIYSPRYPEEFRQEVVRVARNRGPGVTVEQVATDFGVHAMTLWEWMCRADIDDGTKPATTSQESAELRQARRRIMLLE
ncbi:transposase, partial [Streptomyces kronopolitis]|uniref:transposase n=1 Tax=Streptomyces kronopolitis TaxID=1612435 RepID=UPI0036961D8A